MQKVPILPTAPWQAVTPEQDQRRISFPTPTPPVSELARRPVIVLQAVTRASNY